jgi:predicted transcriptional regulator
MPKPPPAGEQELALLRFVAERGGATVGEATDLFAAPRGLARSTVLTMMERLRRKGHLNRRMVDGVYRYQARLSVPQLMHALVERFVEGNLGGSVAPFAAYLNDAADISDEELRQLKEAVERLASTRYGKE